MILIQLHMDKLVKYSLRGPLDDTRYESGESSHIFQVKGVHHFSRVKILTLRLPTQTPK